MSDSEPSAVVYTSPHCASCKQVMSFLDDRGIPFEARDISVDEEALGDLEAEGFMTTPVTRIGDRWIAGFRRGELEAALSDVTGHSSC